MKNAFSEERDASTSFLEEERERTVVMRLVTRSRPFRNCPKPRFQSEAKCEATDMKMIFDSHAKKTHFKIELRCSLGLKVLKGSINQGFD